MVASDGSSSPLQVTALPEGAGPGLRWHPSGNSVLCFSDNAVVSTCVQPGENFGQSTFLTDQGSGPERTKLALSWDGTTIAFNRAVPTKDSLGAISKNYLGEDHVQIFVMPFPDENGDGIAD